MKLFIVEADIWNAICKKTSQKESDERPKPMIRFSIVYFSLNLLSHQLNYQTINLEHNCWIFHSQKQQWFSNDSDDPPSTCLILLILFGIVSHAERRGNRQIVVDHWASSPVLSAVNHRESHRESTVFWKFSRVQIYSHHWLEALSSRIFTRLWSIII